MFIGARIVRIATHPEYQRMGYGSRTIKLLQKYYEVSLIINTYLGYVRMSFLNTDRKRF